MLNGTSTFANPRPDLTDAFYAFSGNEISTVAKGLFPPSPVDTESGQIEVVTKAGFVEAVDVSRARGSAYNRIDTTLSKIDYVTHDYGVEEGIEPRQGVAIQYNQELGAVRKLRYKLDIAAEARVKALVQNTSTFTGSDLYLDTAAVWTTAGTDIIGDVLFAAEKVRANSGVKADTLVVSEALLVSILKNTGVRNCFPNTAVLGRAALEAALPAVFGLSKLMVSGAVNGSGDIFDDGYAFVCKTASAGDGIEMPCLGRTLFYSPDGAADVIIENYAEPQTRSIVYRARNFQTEKIFDTAFGFLLKVD